MQMMIIGTIKTMRKLATRVPKEFLDEQMQEKVGDIEMCMRYYDTCESKLLVLMTFGCI